MKKVGLRLLILFVITVSSIQLAACNTDNPASANPSDATFDQGIASKKPTQASNLPTSDPSSPAVTDALTLEEAKKQLDDQGSVFVDTVEKASQLAGYQVAAPAFVPETFIPQVFANYGIFYVYKLGFGLPNARTPYYVDEVFRPDGLASNDPFFKITQSTEKLEAAGNPVDIEIKGYAGKKVLTPADGKNPARLLLVWSDNVRFYSLEDALTSPLEETTLVKVAASVGIH